MMKPTFLLTAILFLSPLARAADPETINVWPDKAPGASTSEPEKAEGKRVSNVSKPTLEVFHPEKEKDTGAAIIVCPGGGYQALMMDYEGEEVAKWLNTIGVTGIVLKYRVPAPPGTPRWAPALQDAQRSISIVRSKAKEWGIDPQRIGMLGFSAGAHLTAAASTNFDQRTYDGMDDADKERCRPDFGVVIYPGGIVEKGKAELSPEIKVTKETPPQFIVMATDDPVNSENAAQYYIACKKSGVPAELHLYATGGHGFGLHRAGDKPAATWPDRLEE